MLALRTWSRRGSARVAFPAMVLVDLLVLLSRSGWNHEWDWAFSQAAAGTVLTGPLLAGVVAHDRGRRMQPTLAALGGASVRGRLAVLALVISSWGWSVLAWLVAVAVAAVRSAHGGATGRPDLWIFAEAPVLLFMSACLGLAVGSLVRGVLAGPVAAAVTFLARIVVGSLSLGLVGAFAAGGATGTLVGFERSPTCAVAVLTLHASVAALSLVVAHSATEVRTSWTIARTAGLLTAAAVVVACSITLRSVASSHDPYRWAAGHELCLTGSVTVCGPPSARYVLTVSQRTLAASIRSLGTSGITWQTTYVLLHGGVVPADRGTLQAPPEDIHHDTLSTGDVIATLVLPRLCRGLYDYDAAQPILADQRLVRAWLETQLGAPARPGPAPASVAAAYARLQSCAPMTAPLP